MNKKQMRRVSRALKPFVQEMGGLAGRGRSLKTVLTYHGISDNLRFNCISPELFRRHLAWLREHCRVVPLSDLVLGLADGTGHDVDLVSLTFDDGYVNFAENALPILEEYGFHSTVFIPSGKVGFYNDWDEGQQNFEKMQLMTYQQMRNLPKEIVEVGSHGVTHRRLDCLPAATAEEELLVSRRDLEKGTGRPVRFFAFPHGACPSRWLRGNGGNPLRQYLAVCTTRWGRFNSPATIFSIRRIGVWETDTFEDFIDKMQGCYDWLSAKEGVGRFLRNLLPRGRPSGLP